ncbi:MAG: hypothetical protein ACLR7Z_03125 [Bilophila wadsworthia]
MGPEDRRVPLAFEEHDARIDAEAKVQERMPAPDAFCGEGVQKGVRRAGRAFRGAEGEQVKNGSERRVIAHGEALQRAFTVPRREQQGVGHGLHIRADVPEKMPRPRREGPRTDILFHQFGMIRFPALPRNENVPAGAPELVAELLAIGHVRRIRGEGDAPIGVGFGGNGPFRGGIGPEDCEDGQGLDAARREASPTAASRRAASRRLHSVRPALLQPGVMPDKHQRRAAAPREEAPAFQRLEIGSGAHVWDKLLGHGCLGGKRRQRDGGMAFSGTRTPRAQEKG